MTEDSFFLAIHLTAVADLLTCNKILISRKLEQHGFEGVVIDLAFFIQYGVIRIGSQYLAYEVVEVLKLIVAIDFALN